MGVTDAERRTGELLRELERGQTSGLKRGDEVPLSNDATTDKSPYAETLDRTGELLRELERADHDRSPGRGGKQSVSNDATQIKPSSPYAETLDRTGISRP